MKISASVSREGTQFHRGSALSVLLVEDNPADVAILNYAIKAAESSLRIVPVKEISHPNFRAPAIP